MSSLPKVAPDRPNLPDAFNGEIYKSVGKYARSAVLFAFEQMGGPPALARWGEENPDDFYTKLLPKIIARESEVTHHKTVDQLMDVIDGDYVVDGEFDDVQPGEVMPAARPEATQAIQPIQHDWNTSDYDLENDEMLAASAFEPCDGSELVDFED